MKFRYDSRRVLGPGFSVSSTSRAGNDRAKYATVHVQSRMRVYVTNREVPSSCPQHVSLEQPDYGSGVGPRAKFEVEGERFR